jgi:hypothetical protein
MIKARPKYPMDLYGTIYIDNIQKAVVICLIVPTIFPFDAGSSIKIPGCMTYVKNRQMTTAFSILSM